MAYPLKLRMGIEEKLKAAPVSEDTVGTLSFAVDTNRFFVDCLDINQNKIKSPLYGDYAYGLKLSDNSILEADSFMLKNNPIGTGLFALNPSVTIEMLGAYSFTEGLQCVAIGKAAHAGGENSIAAMPYSFAFGQGINTNAMEGQVAFGFYNADGNYLFSLGNGTSDANRSNAFTVDLSGNTETACLITQDLDAQNAALNQVYANDLLAVTTQTTSLTVTDSLSAFNLNVTNNLSINGASVATQNYVNQYTAEFVTSEEVNNIIEENTSITDAIQTQLDNYVPWEESTVAPTDTKKLWIDISAVTNSNPIPIMKYYSTVKKAWVKLGAVWG